MITFAPGTSDADVAKGLANWNQMNSGRGSSRPSQGRGLGGSRQGGAMMAPLMGIFQKLFGQGGMGPQPQPMSPFGGMMGGMFNQPQRMGHYGMGGPFGGGMMGGMGGMGGMFGGMPQMSPWGMPQMQPMNPFGGMMGGMGGFGMPQMPQMNPFASMNPFGGMRSPQMNPYSQMGGGGMFGGMSPLMSILGELMMPQANQLNQIPQMRNTVPNFSSSGGPRSTPTKEIMPRTTNTGFRSDTNTPVGRERRSGQFDFWDNQTPVIM